MEAHHLIPHNARFVKLQCLLLLKEAKFLDVCFASRGYFEEHVTKARQLYRDAVSLEKSTREGDPGGAHLSQIIGFHLRHMRLKNQLTNACVANGISYW